MKRETIIWTILLVLGSGFLIIRAVTGEAGGAFVRTATVSPDDSSVSWTTETDVGREKRDEPDVNFSFPRTIGLWISAFLTLCIFSFLYGDNPAYKLAEAIFVGASAGYAVVAGFWTGVVQQLFRRLTPDLMRNSFLPDLDSSAEPNFLYLVPLILGIMMLWRLSPVGGWISRWPLAFFIGATAGLRLYATLETDFIRQIQSTVLPLVVIKDSGVDWGASIGNTLIVLGVLAALVYFFFSVEHTGIVGGISRVGIWLLMVTFGASFAYTVMARVALLSQRLEFLFDDWLWLIDRSA